MFFIIFTLIFLVADTLFPAQYNDFKLIISPFLTFCDCCFCHFIRIVVNKDLIPLLQKLMLYTCKRYCSDIYLLGIIVSTPFNYII